MRTVSTLALFLFAMHASAQQDLSKYKWRNRVLLFSASSLKEENFVAQYKNFLDYPKKLDDRNLILFTLVKGRIYDKDLNVVSNYDVAALRKKYGLPGNFNGLALIGKDGATKLKKEFPVEPRTVFESIDQMPMRQKEMRENIDD
ncbi:DUF4174 domain-containing protein [Flavimarina sp. Hel_I_48]|uniref:DUF4174 domain-containing protein n=1 Tax=Flavimarina sp. Hel_I_48 TaxID=1392488 RepID=UPI00068E3F2A|nr:DUF4174 domain-containing protein [Flavimarina sp. Hel_I_48]